MSTLSNSVVSPTHREEGSKVTMNLASGRSRRARRSAVLAAVAAVVVLGAAGNSGAASPSITACPPGSTGLICGSIPGDGHEIGQRGPLLVLGIGVAGEQLQRPRRVAAAGVDHRAEDSEAVRQGRLAR